MVVAFILINTELGSENNVKEKLLELPEIEEAHTVYGVYDVIAKIKVESMDTIKHIVFSKIRAMENVRGTLTTIVMEG